MNQCRLKLSKESLTLTGEYSLEEVNLLLGLAITCKLDSIIDKNEMYKPLVSSSIIDKLNIKYNMILVDIMKKLEKFQYRSLLDLKFEFVRENKFRNSGKLMYKTNAFCIDIGSQRNVYYDIEFLGEVFSHLFKENFEISFVDSLTYEDTFEETYDVVSKWEEE